MSKKITAVLLTATVVTGLLFSFGFAVGCGETEEAAREIETTDTEEKPALEGAVYTCPMHPEVTSDEPGECPECGMDLVLKDEIIEGTSSFCPMHPDTECDEHGKCPDCAEGGCPMVEGKTEGT